MPRRCGCPQLWTVLWIKLSTVLHICVHRCGRMTSVCFPSFHRGRRTCGKLFEGLGRLPPSYPQPVIHSQLSTASYPQSAVHSWLSTVARPQTRSRSCAAPARRRVAPGGDGPHRGRVMRRPRQVGGDPVLCGECSAYVAGGHARYRGDQAGRPPPRPGDAAATLRPAGDPAGRSGGSPPGRSPGRRRGGRAVRAAGASRPGRVARNRPRGRGRRRRRCAGTRCGRAGSNGRPPAPPRPRERPRRARGAPL